MIVKEVEVKDYLTQSNLPDADYVVNPYVGCTHGCRYCYACFMKRFTGHDEKWGTFLDVKRCNKPIALSKIRGKKVFLSSVTDCYNECEKEYCITQGIIKQLAMCEAEVSISTKSSLIVRDINLLKEIRTLRIAMSVNTLDESFRTDMDNASPIKERLEALKILHENGIYTILFMSPIFPCITEWRDIIDVSKDFIDEYWFENLNLRGSYKKEILEYIVEKYPDFYETYKDIYIKKNDAYWEQLANEINKYCDSNRIKYKNYFYHRKLVEQKQLKRKQIDSSKIQE